MMNRDERLNRDFTEYTTFLNEYFPHFNTTNENLFVFYKYVNNSFILSDLLLEYDKVTSDKNYYNLLLEFREFYARLLTTVAINDIFLVENITRIIIEKLYRILYGMLKNQKIERSIRKKSRYDMKSALEGNIDVDNFNTLNDLYSDFSKKIHHTIAIPSDYYNLTKRLLDKKDYLDDINNGLEKIEKVFISEVFLKHSPNCEYEETGFKKKVRNNTTDNVIKMLNLE